MQNQVKFMKKPVFLIGLHRSGSTLIKNLLNSSAELAMATDEMHFATPWRKDFLSYANNAGNLKDDQVLFGLVKNIFSAKPYGTFWKDLARIDLDIDSLVPKIYLSSRSPRDILTLLLMEYAQSQKKRRFGAKYPVHFSKIHILRNWWPDCKIIHLVRDPRAICASKLNDDATKYRKYKHPLFGKVIHLGTLLFFILEYCWSSITHIKSLKDRNYINIKFEDIVLNPNKYLELLCNFCEINFNPSMMNVFGKPSSYDGRVSYGFNKKLLYRWKDILSPYEIKLITTMTKKSMRAFGYIIE